MKRPNDEGSTLPLILLCALIAFLLVAGVTAASSAFLAQSRLQSDCDGAAIAGASELNTDDFLTGDPNRSASLPLHEEDTTRAVDKYLASIPEIAEASAVVTKDRVIVECHRVVRVPFGAIFGLSDGLERHAKSSARSPFHKGS